MEGAVVQAILGVAPGYREIVGRSSGRVEFDDSETLADQVDPSVLRDEPCELIVGDAVDLDVEVLWLDPEHRVAYGPADDDRAVAGDTEFANDLLNRTGERDPHVFLL